MLKDRHSEAFIKALMCVAQVNFVILFHKTLKILTLRFPKGILRIETQLYGNDVLQLLSNNKKEG